MSCLTIDCSLDLWISYWKWIFLQPLKLGLSWLYVVQGCCPWRTSLAIENMWSHLVFNVPKLSGFMLHNCCSTSMNVLTFVTVIDCKAGFLLKSLWNFPPPSTASKGQKTGTWMSFFLFVMFNVHGRAYESVYRLKIMFKDNRKEKVDYFLILLPTEHVNWYRVLFP